MYLESGLYTCSALAERFNVSISSKNKNFKRDICKKLEDSGYEYEYISKKKGIEIKGQVGEKELTEIELKKYLISIGFDVKVNVKAVALYIFLLSNDYYKNAPYKKIAQAMIENYNITDYSDIDKLASRLGEWTRKLEKKNFIHATRNADNPWVTFGEKENKVQKSLSELTTAERDTYNKYIEERKKLTDIFYNEKIEGKKKLLDIFYKEYIEQIKEMKRSLDIIYNKDIEKIKTRLYKFFDENIVDYVIDNDNRMIYYIKYDSILSYLYSKYGIWVYPGLTKELNGINSDLIKKFIDFFLLEWYTYKKDKRKENVKWLKDRKQKEK